MNSNLKHTVQIRHPIVPIMVTKNVQYRIQYVQYDTAQ